MRTVKPITENVTHMHFAIALITGEENKNIALPFLYDFPGVQTLNLKVPGPHFENHDRVASSQ